MKTATRGDFTVAERFFSSPADLSTGWWDAKIRSEGGVAVAELQNGSSDGRTDDGWWVWGVKVVEGERGSGLGSALLANLIAQADREGRWMSLQCEPDRSGEWIVSFYERFGFAVLRECAPGVLIMTRGVR